MKNIIFFLLLFTLWAPHSFGLRGTEIGNGGEYLAMDVHQSIKNILKAAVKTKRSYLTPAHVQRINLFLNDKIPVKVVTTCKKLVNRDGEERIAINRPEYKKPKMKKPSATQPSAASRPTTRRAIKVLDYYKILFSRSAWNNRFKDPPQVIGNLAHEIGQVLSKGNVIFDTGDNYNFSTKLLKDLISEAGSILELKDLLSNMGKKPQLCPGYTQRNHDYFTCPKIQNKMYQCHATGGRKSVRVITQVKFINSRPFIFFNTIPSKLPSIFTKANTANTSSLRFFRVGPTYALSKTTSFSSRCLSLRKSVGDQKILLTYRVKKGPKWNRYIYEIIPQNRQATTIIVRRNFGPKILLCALPKPKKVVAPKKKALPITPRKK